MTEPHDPSLAHSARARARAAWQELRVTALDDPLLVLSTVAGLAIVMLCGALVAQLTDDVMEGDGAASFDPRAMRWVVEHRTPTATTIARAVTHLGDPWVVTLVVATAVIALIATRHARLGAFLVLSSGGAVIASSIAKRVVDRPRPPTEIWLGSAWGPSFPSGHATQSVACWVALGVVACTFLRSTAWRVVVLGAATALALLIGTSRVYLGVHWPSDVVCGWSIATMWLLVLLLAGWVRPRLRATRGQRGSLPTPTQTG